LIAKDIKLLEENNIYNVDCLEGFKKLENNSVDYVFTSPPYNRIRNDKYKFYNDTRVDYKDFLSEVITQSMRVAKKYVFFNIQKTLFNKKDVFELIGEFSEQIIEIIIWNKTNPRPANGCNITNAYEFILILSSDEEFITSNNGYLKNTFETSVYSNPDYADIHNAIMHPKAAQYIITNFTKENELILDPFSGMGTTALISIDHNRKYMGFELSEVYCNESIKRLEYFKSQIRMF